MKLPGDAIGVTDIQSYRDCPRRFEFGMRRHTDAGEAPEAQGPSTAYGSALHDAVAYAEAHDATDEQAIQHAFDLHAKWLDPEHLELMHADFVTYRERDYVGVRTVAVEREFKIPLFVYEGRQVWFRGKLDRLYQRLDSPGVFIHVDYKTSRWAKSEQEVHNDTQMWGYNWAIHEEFPECERLVQLYDQLRHGVIPTRKSDAQREQIREWLIRQATAILRDDELAAKKNQWCPWCPIMESCPVIEQLSEYALAEIAALAPTEKRGRKLVAILDPGSFDIYVEQLEPVGEAMKVLKRFDETVKGALKEMPAAERAERGFELRERTSDTWGPEGLRAAHDVLGDDFYVAAGLTKTGLERLGKEDERVQVVLDFAERKAGAVSVVRSST